MAGERGRFVLRLCSRYHQSTDEKVKSDLTVGGRTGLLEQMRVQGCSLRH